MEDYDSIDPVASTLRLELLREVSRILPSKQSLPYNRPLIDQRLALRWIKRHIIGFGGDLERVTFIGESAGGGRFFCSAVILKTNRDRIRLLSSSLR